MKFYDDDTTPRPHDYPALVAQQEYDKPRRSALGDGQCQMCGRTMQQTIEGEWVCPGGIYCWQYTDYEILTLGA